MTETEIELDRKIRQYEQMSIHQARMQIRTERQLKTLLRSIQRFLRYTAVWDPLTQDYQFTPYGTRRNVPKSLKPQLDASRTPKP